MNYTVYKVAYKLTFSTKVVESIKKEITPEMSNEETELYSLENLEDFYKDNLFMFSIEDVSLMEEILENNIQYIEL
jgi:hypothetical protein